MAPIDVVPETVEVPVEEAQGTIKRSPKKIYIPIRIQTNALKIDDIALNATYISFEDMSADVKKTKISRSSKDAEIRYLDAIRSFRDKLKSYSCSQDHCPAIQERWHQHQMEHHRAGHPHGQYTHMNTLSYPPPHRCNHDRHSQSTLSTSDSYQVPRRSIHRVVSTETHNPKAAPVPPATPILKRSSCTRCQESVQTHSKSVDFNHPSQNSFKSNLFRADGQTQYTHCSTPMHADHETNVTPKTSFLRENLEGQIHKWLEDIPVYPSLTCSMKNLRNNIINEFIDKIYELYSDITLTDFEWNVRAEIDNFLNSLPMWYPGAKRDQELLKESIKISLLDKIRKLYDEPVCKKRSVKYEDDSLNTERYTIKSRSLDQPEEDELEKFVESEVLDWLMQIKFKQYDEFGRTINIIDATDFFTKRLMPLLNKPSSTRNYRLILKGLIIDTLNDLPNILHYPKNKRCYLNRISEDLTLRLIGINSRHAHCFDSSFPKERSMYQLAVCGKSSLKQTLMDGLKDCLQNVSEEQRNDIKEEITDILIDCLESVRFKEDIEAKDELINNILGTRSFDISETQTSDITIENVREILTEDIIYSAECSRDVKSCHSETLSIFTSTHDFSGKLPITSTPKKKSPTTTETNRMNKEEEAYMNKVGNSIREWMETLPKKFNGKEEMSFKEVMIKDLAGDIIDQMKLEQLAPRPTQNKKTLMDYTVFKWMWKFLVYDDYDLAKPAIDDLISRINKIPVPTLTMPQMGNRQAMSNVKHLGTERGWEDDFVPKSSDVLEDEISIWMHEQPSDIYLVKSKKDQNKMVHELAETIKNKINNNKQQKELDNDLAKWLQKMLKSPKKDNIESMSKNLKSRIKKVPQGAALIKVYDDQPSLSDKDKNVKVQELVAKIRRYSQDGLTSESELSDDKKSKSKKNKLSTKSNTSDSSQDSKPNKSVDKKKQNKIDPKNTRSPSISGGKPSNNSKTSESDSPKSSAVNGKPTIVANQSSPDREASQMSDANADNDKILMEVIGKYIEHNNNVEDNVAKGAFGEILKAEFQRLDPLKSTDGQDDVSEEKADECSPEKLGMELQYIKDISDWLKNIPIDGSFNTPHNKERIEFVNNLAKKVYELEDGRRNQPYAKDYNAELTSLITERTDQLPILPDHTANVPLMVDQLYSKIVAGRPPMPCCKKSNTTEIQEQNLSKFIDNYIQLNAGEIANDPIKLEAWSARVLEEAKKMARHSVDPATLRKNQIYDVANISIPEEESIRLFGLELDYAKEITEWINNLPLLSLTTNEASENRVKMISELAAMFAERERNKIANPTEPQSDTEIKEYVHNWIHELPLDSNKDVVAPVVIQQLLNRIDRINSIPENRSSQGTADEGTNTPLKTKPKIKSKCSKSRPSCGERGGQLVVEAIEKWSNSIPIKVNNKEDEKNIKANVAKKLFQKVGDLSVDPETMNDDALYQELLADEVEQQLNSVPPNCDLEKKKDSLKKNLVDKVMEAKSLVQASSAGDNYLQQLETTIDASIPNPISVKQTEDPRFEIYKNRLAEMFVLENFDYGTDDVRLKYEKRIKKEIDKYHGDAEAKNAFPISKEEIYSELYGNLFKVPMPDDCSAANEVEEVKTRCEVADWFESLPLQPPSSDAELLKRDKIQSMLAKRLKEIERREQKPDNKLHKEITKWLVKLPLLPGNEGKIDEFANDLKDILKSTKDDRKCVRAPLNDGKRSSKRNSKGQLNTSQVAGPSRAAQRWTNVASHVCSHNSTKPRKKAADVILEIIQNWCDSLPFYESTKEDRDKNNTIKEDLGTKIIIKICELNGDPQVFSDDSLYNYLLDEELEKLMAPLPICCEFESTKDYKKKQLIEAINSVKPLITEERARHEYRKDLNTTVNNFLKEPLDTTDDKMALFNQLREEIVDNFVQLHYNRDDPEGKQIYKANLHDALLKYFLEVQEQPDESDLTPLMKQNQLLCEMAKVPIPSDRAMQDAVEEIRMKDEVKQFFDELALPQESEEKVTNIRVSLAKRLNEIERTGHNCSSDAKMRKEIGRYLKKLDAEVDDEKIASFVDNLKATEAGRKAPPVKNHEGLKPDEGGRVCPPGTDYGSLKADGVCKIGSPVKKDDVTNRYPKHSNQSKNNDCCIDKQSKDKVICGCSKDESKGKVICRCPTSESQDKVICRCPTNPSGDKVICRCPTNQSGDNVICRCPTNESQDKVTCRCPTNDSQDKVICRCPTNESQDVICRCPTNPSAEKVICRCPTNESQDKVICRCPTNDSQDKVICRCPTNESQDKVICRCPTNPSGDNVICRCPTDESQDKVICRCPTNESQEKVICRCSKNQSKDKTICGCPDNLSQGKNDVICRCPNNQTTGKVICRCPDNLNQSKNDIICRCINNQSKDKSICLCPENLDQIKDIGSRCCQEDTNQKNDMNSRYPQNLNQGKDTSCCQENLNQNGDIGRRYPENLKQRVDNTGRYRPQNLIQDEDINRRYPENLNQIKDNTGNCCQDDFNQDQSQGSFPLRNAGYDPVRSANEQASMNNPRNAQAASDDCCNTSKSLAVTPVEYQSLGGGGCPPNSQHPTAVNVAPNCIQMSKPRTNQGEVSEMFATNNRVCPVDYQSLGGGASSSPCPPNSQPNNCLHLGTANFGPNNTQVLMPVTNQGSLSGVRFATSNLVNPVEHQSLRGVALNSSRSPNGQPLNVANAFPINVQLPIPGRNQSERSGVRFAVNNQVTPVEYQGFGEGVALSSSPQPARQPPDAANVGSNSIHILNLDLPGPNQGEGSGGRIVANKRRRQRPTSDNEEDEDCKCLAGRARRKMKARPRCVLKRPQFCDDCNEYGPMWMPMPYRFPPGPFYY